MQATGIISPVETLGAAREAASAGSFPFVAGAPPPKAAAPPNSLWRLALPYVWRYRWMLGMCMGLNAMAGVAIAIQAFAPKFLVDSVLMPAGLSMHDRYVRLAGGVGFYLVIAVLMRMFAWYGSYRIFTKVREHAMLDLRSRFFRHINGLCLRFHGKHSSGELFTYVMGSPLNEISSYYHTVAMNVPNGICTFLVAVGCLSFCDWGLTLILVVSVVATVLSANSGTGRLRELVEDFQLTEGKVIGRVADIFRGNRDVKMYAIEEKMSATFDQSADVLRQKVYDRDVKTHHVNMRQEAVGVFSFVLVAVVAAGRYMNHHLLAGDVFTYLMAFAVLQGPVQLMFQINVARGRAQASLGRLNDVLKTDSSTPEPRRHIECPSNGELAVRDLAFRYAADQPVLKGINLTIPYGQRVALVGPSGSGKSTLAKMFLRLYDPDEGSVSCGGIDLRRCRTADVRHRFGVVPQDPYFFHTTIRENLLIVYPGASAERIRHVCESANIWGFIEQLPDGLDTLIGEGGARLSGGQRQRLAIARALLHDPEYLVFDEATSALDTVSERMVQDAFGRILPGRTSIFIAHRLSTVKDCDRIIVLDEGCVVQDGTFEQLRNDPGMFRRMVESDDF
jgi:ABC-type multidrug transport system fused ATPase/permease subunit